MICKLVIEDGIISIYDDSKIDCLIATTTIDTQMVTKQEKVFLKKGLKVVKHLNFNEEIK